MNTPLHLRWDESGQQQLLARAEALLQQTWFVELDQDERLRRLTARHLRFDNDAAIAEWRATGNDERNARLVAPGSQRSTLVIEHTPATVSAPGRE